MILPTFKLGGLEKCLRAFERIEKQVQFASAVTLTKTAKAVESELLSEMQRQFDRPTPWTMRSTFVKPATKENLVAVVGIKDMQGAKTAAPPAALLAHQFLGGIRIWKNLEKYLARIGRISSDEFIAPGAGARLDRYGNMSRGQIQQILSQLRLGHDPNSWPSNSARSKRNVKKAGHIFWAHGGTRDAHLPRGAWIDMGGSVGLRPLLLVVRRPVYKIRIDLKRIAAAATVATLQPTFERALAEAVATAR